MANATATAKTRQGSKREKEAPDHESAQVEYGLAWVKPSLIKRSLGRVPDVERVGDGEYLVAGRPDLSDNYNEYEVTRGDRWVCSCQLHQGGNYRNLCSHIVAAMIYAETPRITWNPDPEPRHYWWPEEGSDGPVAWPEPEQDQVSDHVLPLDELEPDLFYAAPAQQEQPHPMESLVLPDWCPSLRPHQDQALRAIWDAIQAGKTHIVVEAPTGAGKTLIGSLAAQLVNARSIYVCTTKSLQDQFMADFPMARMIKGRTNYPTQNKPFPEWTCEDCDWKKDKGCSYCPSRMTCPYQVAKRAAETANTAVANTAYYLAMSNGPGRCDNVPGKFGHDEQVSTTYGLKGRGLAIFDESDELENVLLGWVEFRVGPKILRQLNDDQQLEKQQDRMVLRAPIPPLPDPQKSRWPERIKWLEAVAGEALRLAEQAQQDENERAYKRWIRVYEQAQWVLEDISESRATVDESKEPWIYDVENGAAVFKPVRVAKYGSMLFAHSHLSVIMSATITGYGPFLEDLGIDPAAAAFVEVASTFPKERRPVFATPCANVTHKNKDKAYPALVRRITQIVQAYPYRTLVHTVSYDLARYMAEQLRPVLGDRVITYSGSQERDWALEQLRGHPQGVLLAPSMERGINLKGDDCRNVIVAKVPWPNQGDKRVKRRQYQPTPRQGEQWYRRQTLRAIIQMTGRGMRSASDWCRTWILDEQFLRLWRESRSLMPAWWAEAVQTDERDPISILGIDKE